MRGLMLVAMSLSFLASQAHGQDVSVPAVTTASPGGYANPLKLDTDRYRQRQGARQPAQKQAAAGCSADAMPAPEKRRIEAEYARIAKSRGRVAANGYARQQGALFREKLVAQGVCPPLGAAAASTRNAAGAVSERASGKGRAVGAGKQGKCTRTTMQARNIANPGGGAMSMIMVPVCLN